MKILLVNILPGGEEDRVSLGIASLKAYALQSLDLYNRVKITIKNFNTDQSFYTILQYIDKLHPNVIGFSCFVWNLEYVSHLVKLVKLVLSNVYIILGGPEVSPIADEVLVHNGAVDIIVRGYGEKSFVEIIRNLLTGSPPKEDIKGISFCKDKLIISNPYMPIVNLNEIPSLYRCGLLPEIELTRTSRILYETSRGCIFNCHFCYYDSQQKGSIQTHSLERIESDLLFFMKHRLERVSLVDSLLNFDNVRACSILNFILKHNRKTKFEFEIRGDLLNKKSIALLNELAKRKFLFRVDIGLQSIHPKVLKNIGCTVNLQRLFTNISLFQFALKKVTTIDLIYGLPGDSYVGFKESLDYSLQKLSVNTQCALLQILPGTKLYENATKFRLVFDPLPPHYVYSNCTYSLNDVIRSRELVDSYYFLFNNFTKRATMSFAKNLNIKLVDIFEKFTDWRQKQNSGFVDTPYSYNNLKKFFKEICIQWK